MKKGENKSLMLLIYLCSSFLTDHFKIIIWKNFFYLIRTYVTFHSILFNTYTIYNDILTLKIKYKSCFNSILDAIEYCFGIEIGVEY